MQLHGLSARRINRVNYPRLALVVRGIAQARSDAAGKKVAFAAAWPLGFILKNGSRISNF